MSGRYGGGEKYPVGSEWLTKKQISLIKALE